jgi:hypothetical protein
MMLSYAKIGKLTHVAIFSFCSIARLPQISNAASYLFATIFKNLIRIKSNSLLMHKKSVMMWFTWKSKKYSRYRTTISRLMLYWWLINSSTHRSMLCRFNVIVLVHEIHTISPSWIFLRAKRPHPCMPDLPKQTRWFSVLWNHTSEPTKQSENKPLKRIIYLRKRSTCKW